MCGYNASGGIHLYSLLLMDWHLARSGACSLPWHPPSLQGLPGPPSSPPLPWTPPLRQLLGNTPDFSGRKRACFLKRSFLNTKWEEQHVFIFHLSREALRRFPDRNSFICPVPSMQAAGKGTCSRLSKQELEEVPGINRFLGMLSPPPPIPCLQECIWGLRVHLCTIHQGGADNQLDAANWTNGMFIHSFPSVLGPPFAYKQWQWCIRLPGCHLVGCICRDLRLAGLWTWTRANCISLFLHTPQHLF